MTPPPAPVVHTQNNTEGIRGRIRQAIRFEKIIIINNNSSSNNNHHNDDDNNNNNKPLKKGINNNAPAL